MSVTNLLPNTQWQIATGLFPQTKMNPEGIGTVNPLIVTSYSTVRDSNGFNLTTFQCADTSNLQVNDLVAFYPPTGSRTAWPTTLSIASCRVVAISTDVSFSVYAPLGLTFPDGPTGTYALCGAIQSSDGIISPPVSGNAFDGWGKNVSLAIQRDTYAENSLGGSFAGSSYQAYCRKGSSSEEILYCPLYGDGRSMALVAGRTVVFRVTVYQKLQQGSGTWRAFIVDSYSTTYSASAPSSSGYQDVEVTATISANSTTASVGIAFDGEIGDVYYVAQPMCTFGTTLGPGSYQQNPNEDLIPLVKITPASFSDAYVTFPSTADAVGYYSFRFDPYAETNGAIAPTVKTMNTLFEGRCGTWDTPFAVRDVVLNPIKYSLVVYPGATDSSAPVGTQNQKMTYANDWILGNDSIMHMYSIFPAVTWYNVSLDIVAYRIN